MRKGRVCYMEVLFWLGIMVTFLIIEAITVGLTTIWFAIGAFFAMIAAALGVMTPIQIVIFFAVSLTLLLFTRPIVVKYVNPHKIKTNYEDAVDKNRNGEERLAWGKRRKKGCA